MRMVANQWRMSGGLFKIYPIEKVQSEWRSFDAFVKLVRIKF